MLSLKDIKTELAKVSIEKVAEELGISKATLYNIKSGKNDNPRLKTMEALTDYFLKS